MTLDMVMQALESEGFDVRAPAGEAVEASSPWYLRVLLGFTGWIGGLMLIGSLSGMFAMLVRNEAAGIVTGAALCTAAGIMYRKVRGDIASQFALAMSMCGQGLIVFGFAGYGRQHEAAVAAAIVVFEVVLVVVMRNSLHRFLSSLFALGALAFALSQWNSWAIGGGLLAIAYAQLVLHESRWRTSSFASLTGAVLPALCLAVITWPIPSEWQEAPKYLHGGSTLAAGLSVAFVLFASSAWRGASATQRIAAIVAAAIFCFAAWRAPGLIASALVIGAGYRMGSRETTGLGVLGFLAYLGAHYYLMSTTLLAKSISLALTGAVLLAVAAALHFMHRGGKP